MSAERTESIKRIVAETPGFLPPENQNYCLKSYVNNHALEVIFGLDRLLVDRGGRNEIGLDLNEPPHFTTIYSPDNPNLIGVMIVGLEKDQINPENITVRRQIVIIDHDLKEVENFEEFNLALQERRVDTISLKLDDSQDSPIEQVLINEEKTKVIILKGKIIGWTLKQEDPELPGITT